MKPESENHFNWQLAAMFVVAACLIAGFTFYFTKRSFDVGEHVAEHVLTWPGKIADKLGKLFQTNVSVSNSSFTLDQKDIVEFAVVQRRIICTTKYDASWLGSEATVIVQGTYLVKAGYNLKEGYKLAFDENGKAISIQLPEPKILSNTTENQTVMFASEGILKKIPPKEMETVFGQNLEQAKREADDLGLLIDAKTRIKGRLNDLLGDDVLNINLSTSKL